LVLAPCLKLRIKNIVTSSFGSSEVCPKSFCAKGAAAFPRPTWRLSHTAPRQYLTDHVCGPARWLALNQPRDVSSASKRPCRSAIASPSLERCHFGNIPRRVQGFG